MPKGDNPNSRANLTGEGAGRKPAYDTPKKTREVSVTDEGWKGCQAIAKELGISVSELLERLGRGHLAIGEP